MTLGLEYNPDDYRYGLSCMECDRPFFEGMRYTKRIEAVAEDDMVVTNTICVGCSLEVA